MFLLTTLSPLLLAAPQTAAPSEVQRVYYDWIGPQGELRGGSLLMPQVVPRILPTPPVQTSSWLTGDPAKRVDMVFVGDGYTAAELGSFQNHANGQAAAFFQKEPFERYAPYFNVHLVEVISNESGVDNDPTQGISRDTALDMRFWCNGIERLLCVNVSKAYSFANNAPDVDFVVAVANSTKYGGAGYPSNNLGTVSGGNGSASEVMIHEMGHAMGNLADEYTYGGPATWTGGEPGARNVSTFESVEMAATGTKWAAWAGSQHRRLRRPDLDLRRRQLQPVRHLPPHQQLAHAKPR